MTPEQRSASAASYAEVLQELLIEMADRYARVEAILREHECPALDTSQQVVDRVIGEGLAD